MSAHTGRLLLSAQDPLLLPDPTRVITGLIEAGFLGGRLAPDDHVFAVGERFLQLVTFAGCSVHIELSPTVDAPFCHIRIVGPFAWPVYLSGRNTRPPRCRNCRSPLKDWKRRLLGWCDAGQGEIGCPVCGASSPPWDYDWKENAGFGRLFLQIEEAFPGEAVPTAGLVDLLERLGRCKWRYFYIQDG
jgi:hypothetical protein